jgi:LmbE family N-acetylglucosaminyl deacetylase
MTENIQRILVLAPHTDDGEFGCGGTISKFVSEGKDVFYAAFSACKQSVLPQFPEDILISEVKEATQILGIKPANLILFDYDVRTFGFRRQDILDDLIRLRDSIKPDLIFMPTLTDVHQDHRTIAEEALRAFKFNSILSYELPWNNYSFTTSSFVHLEEEHIQIKVNALKAYQSQAHRSYSDEDFIRSLGRTRGVQIGIKYAEAFELVRWIIK